jgi:hypothetical protein
MDKLDLADELIERGVDEGAANRLKGQINGNDLMDLISAFNSKRPYQGQLDAQRILGKYGIKLERTNMSSNYLNAKFESLRRGKALDESSGVMTRLNEGFNYEVAVTEQTRDRVLDYLDDQGLEYEAATPLAYRISFPDRETAYRTGQALSRILSKPTVRDSVEIEEKMSKNPDKRVRDAKEKMATLTPRNPVVAAVKTRSGAGVHGKVDPRKDPGRKAKYKPRFDEEIDFTVGEDVMVGEVAGQIKIPHGPNGTIGVIMNGQLEMVSEAEVSRLDEGVMGMIKPMNPLFRLRELAGLPLTTEDDFDGIEVADAPEIDPEGMLSAGPVGNAPEDMDVNGMGDDPVADPMDDMDGGIDEPLDATLDIEDDDMPDTDLDVSDMVDPQAGVPGALGSDPVEMPGASTEFPDALGGVGPGLAPVAPTQSDAMAQIEDALNNIQTGLADIRLSEYKSLIKKLQDLTNQAQMMGRDYLGEMRRLKR